MAHKPDFTAIVKAVTEYWQVRQQLKQIFTTRVYQPKDSPCPDDPAAMCKALNDWFQAYYAWALSVEDRLPGGPGDTPPPPPPPFKG